MAENSNRNQSLKTKVITIYILILKKGWGNFGAISTSGDELDKENLSTAIQYERPWIF